MNYCVITGNVSGNLQYEMGETERVCKFKVYNRVYKAHKGDVDTQIIPCRAYGNLAEYVNAEIYNNCEVLILGRIRVSTVKLGDKLKPIFYVYCYAVTKLEQNEYD